MIFHFRKKRPMKKVVLLLGLVSSLALLSQNAFASHIVGGEMSYACLGDNQYQITLKVFRDCYNGQAPFDNPTTVTIYYTATAQLYTTVNISFPGSDTLNNNPGNPCLIVPPGICVEEADFVATITLPPVAGGYTLIYARCCRNLLVQNLLDPTNTGAADIATIPDTSLAACNSSPYFNNFPPTVICVNQPFTFDHSATDPDGDSLVYELCAPYTGGDALNPYPVPAPPPPYGFVTYNTSVYPYSATDPMGGNPTMSIDPVTGLMTVTPNTIGNFVVGVCVEEYRNGQFLGEHKRDFQFNVVECTPSVVASIPNVINNCSSFTVTFENNSFGGNIYHWDFGVPGMTNDTSNLFSPTFTYPDTGVYTVHLYVNPGTTCGDTATATVYIYPTLTGAMAAPDGCEGNPVQFYDQSTTTYGTINSWHWSFGDGGVSTAQNPSHSYADTGTYTVQFIVGTNMGCVDTVTETVVIYPSPSTNATPNDTIICSLDNIQLNASGTGNFNWQPNYGLSNNNISNPLASPDVTTTYTVTVSNQYGCYSQDSVKVTVFDSVSVFAGNDTTICPGGAVQLNATGGQVFLWSPANGLNNPNIHNPIATPSSTTTYVLTSSIGSCTGSDAVTIFVKPVPHVTAGADQTICQGSSVQISASGLTSYSWSPAASLSDPNISDPIASPITTTTYYVTGADSNACPILVLDSLVVNVLQEPAITIHPDTSIILGTCVDLYVTGGATFQWMPGTGLDDATSSNPVACPTDSTVYHVFITTAQGCTYEDSVIVGIRLDPIVIFPTAFSPDGNGKNDIFRPVILGLAHLDDFRVFNRWGELVFERTGLDVAGGPLAPSDSWDGTFKGKDQPVGVYAYELKGTATATGKSIERKGTVTLVR